MIIPLSNPGAILANIVVAGITEAGTWQSSDLMSDFKTAHLIGTNPSYLFYAQIIGSLVGAFVSSAIYKLFTSVYTIPSDVFRIPNAHLLLLTARLVYGKGLPIGVWPFALASLLISACCGILRVATLHRWWNVFIPNGVSIAIGELYRSLHPYISE